MERLYRVSVTLTHDVVVLARSLEDAQVFAPEAVALEDKNAAGRLGVTDARDVAYGVSPINGAGDVPEGWSIAMPWPAPGARNDASLDVGELVEAAKKEGGENG